MLQEVFKSEADTNQRNQAIGVLMFAYGYIKADWGGRPLHRQCSIGVNATDLAVMAATLASWRQEPGHEQAGHQGGEGAGGSRGDGDGRALR